MSRVELHVFPVGNTTGTVSGGVRCTVNKWKFQDKMMGEQFVSFNITSEKPIDWAVGDYCIFRGETFTLNYVPTVTQKARTGERQDAYTYENVKFESRFEELTRCIMLDIIPTNELHNAVLGTEYTGGSKFQLYCGETSFGGTTYTPVCALALKMQANLDRMLGEGTWEINVDTTTTYTDSSGVTKLVTHTDEKVLSFDNMTVAKALEEVHNTFKLDYCVKGRTILIGHTLNNLTSDNDENTFAFGYGKGYPTHDDMGTGLFKLKRVANSQQKIVTRLRAMGSTKNMPYRHYHSRYGLSQSLFPTNLQLPNTFDDEEAKAEANASRDDIYGVNELNNLPYIRHVKGDTNDAYIEKNDDAAGCPEGVREDSARWDGSNGDLPEIYPTIEGVTYKDLRGNSVQDQDELSGPNSFVGYGNDERVDELLAIGYKSGGTMIDDANIGDGILTEDGDTGFGTLKNCLLTEQRTRYNNQNNGEFASSGGYLLGQEHQLFSVQDVYAGEYSIVPTHGLVYFVAWMQPNSSVSAGRRTVSHADIGFRIKVKQTSKSSGETTTIATYTSNTQLVYEPGFTSSRTGTRLCEIEFPSLPDVGESNPQLQNIAVTEFSDIVVTITPIMRNVYSIVDEFDLVYRVGNSETDTSITGSPKCSWSLAGTSDSDEGNFHVFIKDMGFNIEACFTSDDPVIYMKDGSCVGQEFKICKVSSGAEYNGKKGYMLTLERAKDSSLNRYFPSNTNQIAAGDRFVLLNINMPNAYIEAAEMRLLRAASDYLADNCETKFTYQPSIDDIYLQRNLDKCRKENREEESIFWRLYAGLKFTFIARFASVDDSLGDELVTAELTIEQVTIQMGDGFTPKVEIRLNDDVQQSTLQKLTTSIDRIYSGSIFSNGTGGGGSGLSMAQILSLVQDEGAKQYVSKRHDDVARGIIGFVSGLWVAAKGLFGFDEEGRVTASSLKATGTSGNTVTDTDNTTQKNIGLEVTESGIIGGILRVAKSVLTKTTQSLNFTGGDSMFGTGWQLTDNDGNGNSRLVVDNLFVRMKAVFNELEVRKFVAMAGNYVFSPAASIIEEVDYIGLGRDDEEIVLGYEYVKVPWVLRLVPISLLGKILSRKKMVRSSVDDIDFSEVVKFRCWLKSDDGTTRTINTWKVGMLAKCQTFDIGGASGTGNNNGKLNGEYVKNKHYWRAVTAVGQALSKDNYSLPNHILDDGLTHNYIDLANYTDANDVQLYYDGSDNPEAFDHIVCYGDWLDRDLSNLITLETVGSEAPCIKELLGVGYTDGSSINWNLTGKVRTQISPVAGNKFVAPSFVVTTDGALDEYLYNETDKGEAYKTQFVSGQEIQMAPDGSVVLLAYDDIDEDYALKTLHVDPPSVQNPAYGFIWTNAKAKPGDSYVCKENGHRYVATKTGWKDRGEAVSTLRVDMNGITSRVSDAEGNITQLQQTAAGLVSSVTNSAKCRNLLTGVLTGAGWKSGLLSGDDNDGYTYTQSGNITIDNDGWFVKNAQADNCFVLEGITLEEGKKYMLSFCAAAVFNTGTAATDYPAVQCRLVRTSSGAASVITATTNGSTEQRAISQPLEITSTNSGTYTLYIVASKMRYPQLEFGEVATEFTARADESSSRIAQAADAISLLIANALGQTGIDIVNGVIQLIANKTKFLTSDNKPMIAVQMCNENGEVDPNGLIPSIVFYDDAIGNGGEARFTLNYLGLLSLVNSSVAQSWESYTLEWLGTRWPSTGEEYYEYCIATGMDRYQIIHAEAFCQLTPYNNQPYDENLIDSQNGVDNRKDSGTAYWYKSAYHTNQNDEKVYDPRNGKYKENRFWDKNTVSPVSFLPSANNMDADGFYIVTKSYHDANPDVFRTIDEILEDDEDFVIDPSLHQSGQSHVSPVQLSVADRIEAGMLAPAAVTQGGYTPIGGGNDPQQLDWHDIDYILLEVKDGYIYNKYSFTVRFETVGSSFLMLELDNGDYVRVSRIHAPSYSNSEIDGLWMDIDTIIYANQLAEANSQG